MEAEAIEHAVGTGPEAAVDVRGLHRVPDPFERASELSQRSPGAEQQVGG